MRQLQSKDRDAARALQDDGIAGFEPGIHEQRAPRSQRRVRFLASDMIALMEESVGH
jgi:hypothetical protein